LPPPRHDDLNSFRVLIVEGHPLLPPDKDVRTAIEKLAGNLAKAGAKVSHESPLLPDFVESSRLYMRRLLSFLGTFFLPEVIAGAKAAAAQLSPDDKSLAAERLRGITQSHSGWVIDDGARARLRVQWHQLFKSFDA
jgi:amidase